jgi:hypothetical protein
LKRTLRIEIVRYSRRITVTEGSHTPAVSDELPTFDVIPARPEGRGRAAGRARSDGASEVATEASLQAARPAEEAPVKIENEKKVREDHET